MRKEKKLEEIIEYINKKGINASAVIILILSITVGSAIGYNSWFKEYFVDVTTEVESQDAVFAVIDTIEGDSLYFKNLGDVNISIEKVSIGEIDCNVTSIATPGMNEINIGDCTLGLTKKTNEVVVYAKEGIFSKHMFIKNAGMGSFDSDSESGSETDSGSGDDDVIGALGDCETLSNIRNNLTGDYFLTQDIYCFDTKEWGEEGFVPIGDLENKFTGTFNGNGHTIYGLYINTSENYAGLFGAIENATVSDIVLDGYSISGGRHIGSLAGYVKNANLSKIYVNGNVSSEERIAGGIIGYLENSVISKSYSRGKILSSELYSGGLVGYVANSTISDSYSWTWVNSTEGYIGGLAGYVIDSHIENSYSTGVVASNEETEVGGFVGYSEDSDVISSYWDIDTSNQLISAGGVGENTAIMQDIDTYSGWDSSLVWTIQEGEYPLLR